VRRKPLVIDQLRVLNADQLSILEDDEHHYLKTKEDLIGTPIYYYRFRDSIIKYEFNIWSNTCFFSFKIKGEKSEEAIVKASEVVHIAKVFIADDPILGPKYEAGTYPIQLGIEVIDDLSVYRNRVRENYAEVHIDQILALVDDICDKPLPAQKNKDHYKYHWIHLYGEDVRQLAEALSARGLATYKTKNDHTYDLYLNRPSKLRYLQGEFVYDEIVNALRDLGFVCFKRSEHSLWRNHLIASSEVAYGTNGTGGWFYPLAVASPFLLLICLILLIIEGIVAIAKFLL
jgi:hypothetical protein